MVVVGMGMTRRQAASAAYQADVGLLAYQQVSPQGLIRRGEVAARALVVAGLGIHHRLVRRWAAGAAAVDMDYWLALSWHRREVDAVACAVAAVADAQQHL